MGLVLRLVSFLFLKFSSPGTSATRMPQHAGRYGSRAWRSSGVLVMAKVPLPKFPFGTVFGIPTVK